MRLADRYTSRAGTILITGVQALVRLMLLQAERDRAAGLKTGGFVSGYRGSPLGTLDMAFAAAGQLVKDYNVVVRPAVNEELAATAIAGTQQIEQSPGANIDGVFALWYGKGPGLDRAADAIRHGNYQGTSSRGGVVIAVGDDHAAKSSSIPCYSDETVASLQVPILYPSDPEEIVRFGLHAFAASRVSGSWMALKILNENADSTRTVGASELEDRFVLPSVVAPEGGLYNRWPITPLEQEAIQQDYRLPLVLEYVRLNGLDRVVRKGVKARTGIVAAGKSWLDVVEALRLLGIDEDKQAAFGIALYKPAMIWPLEPSSVAGFATGLDEIIVVEEKAGLIEAQIKSHLYGRVDAPRVFGKHRRDGSTLFPTTADLSPNVIALALGEMLEGEADEALGARLAEMRFELAARSEFAVPPVLRKPFFCSGCPHNRSTVVPDGSRALAGIGCHGLAAYNRPSTASFAQMGGEGIHWLGLAPFTDEKHVFANMGDGTYFHSGLLAIRQAVSSGENITYKLLYNSAVAMTGGQAVDGELSVLQLVEQIRAEGVQTIVLSTDDPHRYTTSDPVRRLVSRVEHRDELDALQREMRDVPGVSVIVYEQICATEKRRLRKRGTIQNSSKRLFINSAVCEGCGDCSVKSNCLSVEPVRTDFGTKRRINQSSCNMDFSCLDGFCPSFVTVEGGTVRGRSKSKDAANSPAPTLPLPVATAPTHQRILVAGIGGTGVVTISALLSAAAHIGGKKAAVLDQIGLAQKGGAVSSHVHLGGDAISALRIPPGEADLIIACDQIVGNAREVIASAGRDSTYVLANADVAVTGDFAQDPDAIADTSILSGRLARVAGEHRFRALPFTRLAEKLLGDAIGSNLMMVGMAYQLGWLVIDIDDFRQAVEGNGVSVAMNLAAFEWGRKLAIDPDGVIHAADMADPEPESVDERIGRRTAFLEAYQNAAYANDYSAFVARVRDVASLFDGGDLLLSSVAESLFKLMAYKDEYEVARLYRSISFREAISRQFEGDFTLKFHLAPPVLSPRDRATGHLKKRQFGAWILPFFGLLAKAKRLRGTRFDPFGYTAERRTERSLITEYKHLIESLLPRITAENVREIMEIAELPMMIRGYGHIKDAAIQTYRGALAERLSRLDRLQVAPISKDARGLPVVAMA